MYCAAGDFYVDPWRSVERAVVTHAHSDHARRGMGHYVCSPETRPLLLARLGEDCSVTTLPWGERVKLGEASISLHPAGHIWGSAQVRVEVNGEVWVVTGDCKTDPDPAAQPFELVRCHGLIIETTFGLPIYRWPNPTAVCAEIASWWQANAAEGRASVVYAYTLGKSQRLIQSLGRSGPIALHGAVANMNSACRAGGLPIAEFPLVSELSKDDLARSLVVAPPSAAGTPWMRRLGDASTAAASGWMQVRGMRRRRALDRGFVLSDHVDWPSLLRIVDESGAERICTTHGYAHQVARYLAESRGLDACPLETAFGHEEEEASA